MERHVGRHCGRDFKLPWQRGWPLGWPESTKAPFFLKLFVVHCLAACSRFNLSSRGHSETKKARFAWQYWPFLAILVCLAGLTVNNGIGAPKMGKFSLKHGSGSIWRAQFAFRTKIMWKVKCFGPLWAPAPCKNKKKRPLSPKTSRWSCPGAAQMRFLGSN